jgi:hypothetical protein
LLSRFELEDVISQATHEIGWRALFCLEKVHEEDGGRDTGEDDGEKVRCGVRGREG